MWFTGKGNSVWMRILSGYLWKRHLGRRDGRILGRSIGRAEEI